MTPPAAPAAAAPTKHTCSVCREEDRAIASECSKCCSRFCTQCLATMFRNAIKDRSAMPPACCARLIPLHLALPDLALAEAERYRSMFDEVMMHEEGFYCPNVRCASFISGAHIDAAVANGADGSVAAGAMAKRDSAVSGVDAPPQVECQRCRTLACTACHHVSHAGRACAKQSAQDEDLAKALEKWGYKQCPRCHSGVRRMYGCSVIQCGWCAYQFCWLCLLDIGGCEERGCEYEGEDNYQHTSDEGESETDDDDYDDNENAPDDVIEDGGAGDVEHNTDEHQRPDSVPGAWPAEQPVGSSTESVCMACERAVTAAASEGNTTIDERQGPGRLAAARIRLTSPLWQFWARRVPARTDQGPPPPSLHGPAEDEAVAAAQQVDTEAVARQENARRPRPDDNLDGRSPGYWADSGLNFGDEPNGAAGLEFKRCRHSWDRYGEGAVGCDSSAQIECHRCWRPVVSSKRDEDDVEVGADGSDGGADEASKAKGKLQLRRGTPGVAQRCVHCGFLACESCVERMGKNPEV